MRTNQGNITRKREVRGFEKGLRYYEPQNDKNHPYMSHDGQLGKSACIRMTDQAIKEMYFVGTHNTPMKNNNI